MVIFIFIFSINNRKRDEMKNKSIEPKDLDLNKIEINPEKDSKNNSVCNCRKVRRYHHYINHLIKLLGSGESVK
jgi:hypothetical protein